jgi:hypothetical protein
MDRLRLLAETEGYFTRSDALESGYDDNAVRRAINVKLWTRVRQGTYTFTDLWTAADATARHRARARATARRHGGRVALSHVSAAVEHGFPTWGADLSMVHLTRLDGGAGRTEAGVVHHEGLCLNEDFVERDGLLVTKPARAALEAASLSSAEAAVTILDFGLHAKLFSREELDRVFGLMQSWPHLRKLQVPVRFADGRAESVGESRSRFLCYVHGLPAPELQFYVYDDNGELIGITDFAWPRHRLLGEFDGRVKYGRLLQPGEDPGDVVFREKVREDELREATGCAMVRLIWRDLYHGPATAARIRRLMQVAA